MIRAPNQLSPKTKVVDLLFLYNFYFGQISCSHMEFGVSACQFQVKIIQTKKQCLHCARTPPIPPLWPPASSSTRRQSRPTSASERRSYPRGRLEASRPVPPFSFLGARRAEASRAHRAGRPSPPQLVSSRSKPPHLALHLLRRRRA